MYVGKSYKLSEFIFWTRKNIYESLLLAFVPVFLYEIFDWKWLGVPPAVVAFVGTATALIVGFKNTQTYSRLLEAQQIWVGILNSSRMWGIMSRDFIDNPGKRKELIYRHFAWLAAMRYEMREKRPWESTHKKFNVEYLQFYAIPEKNKCLHDELSRFLTEEERNYILTTRNKASQLMNLQSKTLKELLENKEIPVNYFIEMQKLIKDFFDQQGKSERIKNFPYPRQYSIINRIFVRFFCFLLPFGMLREFDKLNEMVEGALKGNMVWLLIPFSLIISWMYTSLEQVGESTENPFEGSANDVPISHMSRTIEIDLREALGETDLPDPLEPQHNIML